MAVLQNYIIIFRISNDVLGWEIKLIQHLNSLGDKERLETSNYIGYVASSSYKDSELSHQILEEMIFKGVSCQLQ